MNAEELRLLDERICDKCAYEMRYSRKCHTNTCTLLVQVHSEIERAEKECWAEGYCKGLEESEPKLKQARIEGARGLILKICEENKLHNRGNIIEIKLIDSYIAEMESGKC